MSDVRKCSARETLAVVTLPALVVAAVYMIAFRLDSVREVAALRERLVRARAQVPSDATADAQDARLEELRVQLDTLRSARAQRETSTARPRHQPLDGVERVTTRASLAQLLARHDLRLLHEDVGPVELGAALADTLGAESGTHLRTSATTLRFEGRYGDVLAALEELAGSDLRVLPLRLEMRRVDDSLTRLDWTLVIA